MLSLAGRYAFGERVTYPDGITSNLKFTTIALHAHPRAGARGD
jgi:hypothetical protein